MTSREIRQQFLDYFARQGHTIVPSSPVVPHDDPTLMFTNAGMNQFKEVFLGTGKRSYVRAADTQKCIRAGGKHNDLDDVGKDTYHHTFFEMLGNWSFGDYFKKEAITWAWELLTKVWKLPRERLHATYFQGDAAEGLEPDHEARDLWRTVTDIDPSHIHPGNKKDNFWEMGDTGPCGPCSEIHIDLTPDRTGRDLVNKGDARVMELWNLVFIQYNRGADGRLSPLPAKHVDTGMGFERITSVLQGKTSNYDTDVFTPIFAAIQKRCDVPDYRGTLPGDTTKQKATGNRQQATEGAQGYKSTQAQRGNVAGAVDQTMIDVAYRVIADHIRTLTFAVTDGAMPSNEGRGYVLRRILRRAVRYGRQYFGMEQPFLCDLVPSLVENMGDVFPELRKAHGGRNVEHVTNILRDEETSFLKTLDRGIKLFNEAADYAIAHLHSRFSGDDAFKLHDTYGFPIDLTELMAEERGLTVDFAEYERLMEEAQDRARSSDRGDASFLSKLNPDLLAKIPETNDAQKHETRHLKAEVTAIMRILDDEEVRILGPHEPLSIHETGALILDESCFYAEQGGQVGDRGIVTVGDDQVDWFDVTNTIRAGSVILHVGRVKRGAFAIGEPVDLAVDGIRENTKKNHTATHVMNWALREVLGDHVQQKGSLVDPEKTRFDFSHVAGLTLDEVKKIEALVNDQIERNLPVYDKVVNQKAALKIHGLRAVFGEKYPDRVRVVSIGVPIGDEGIDDPGTLLGHPHNPNWWNFSVEFCGGTHLRKTGEAERFVLTHEEAVAKGVRRVVGVTAKSARDAEAAGASLTAEAEQLGKSSPEEVEAKLPALQERLAAETIPLRDRMHLRDAVAELQKIAKQAKKAQAGAATEAALDRAKELLASAPTIGSTKLIVGEMPDVAADQLRQAIDWFRQKTESSAVLLVSTGGDKVTLLAGMSRDVVDRGVKAGDLIKEMAPLVGGRGGGRPDLAQGGGPDAGGAGKVIEQATAWLRGKLS